MEFKVWMRGFPYTGTLNHTEIYRNECLCVYPRTHSLAPSTEARAAVTPANDGHAEHWDPSIWTSPSTKRNQDSSEEQGCRRENTKRDRSIFPCRKVRRCSMNNGRISKGHGSQFKGAPSAQSWADLSIEINTVTDYNSINKVGIHESILI